MFKKSPFLSFFSFLKKRSWKGTKDRYNSPPLSRDTHWVESGNGGFVSRTKSPEKEVDEIIGKCRIRLPASEEATLFNNYIKPSKLCGHLQKLRKTEICIATFEWVFSKVSKEAKQKRVIHWVDWTTFNWRVWSWLRLNAGGRPNTCKSSGNREKLASLLTSGGRVSKTWEFAFRRGTTTGNGG